ncbi:MAG: hypothetical protein ACT4OM_04715 [Actinomycetota bacterium]
MERANDNERDGSGQIDTALEQLLKDHGTGIALNARVVRGLLNDSLGESGRRHHLRVNLLATAVEAGVTAELLELGRADRQAMDRLRESLELERGLSADSARWSVETWARVLCGLGPEPPTEAQIIELPVTFEPKLVAAAPKPATRQTLDLQVSRLDPRYRSVARGVLCAGILFLVLQGTLAGPGALTDKPPEEEFDIDVDDAESGAVGIVDTIEDMVDDDPETSPTPPVELTPDPATRTTPLSSVPPRRQTAPDQPAAEAKPDVPVLPEINPLPDGPFASGEAPGGTVPLVGERVP